MKYFVLIFAVAVVVTAVSRTTVPAVSKAVESRTAAINRLTN